MLNKTKHQLIMGKILRDIYHDTTISSRIGFKGGTCAHFFYGLPRFSVDLDFDLFSPNDTIKKSVFKKMNSLLEQYGTVKNSYIKRFTVFLLLSYGDADHNIKLEINTRMALPNLQELYELKEYLGISMIVATQTYLFTSKLASLTLRKETAMRDVYDIWFFAKNNWDIDRTVLHTLTQKNVTDHISDCIALIEQIKDNQIFQGLGELLSEKEKVWIKKHLREETLFLLKNYRAALQ